MTNPSGMTRQEDELDVSNILKDLRNKWHYFLIAGIIFLALAVLYIKFSLPVYRATSSILIEDSKSSSANIEDILSSDLFGSSLNLPTEIGILKSRLVLQNTIDKLSLAYDYTDVTSYPKKPLYKNTPFKVVVDTIHPLLNEIPFEITFRDNGKFHLDFQYDGNNLPEFSVNGDYSIGQTISHKYFTIRITGNDSLSLPEPGSSYNFTVRSRMKLIAKILENLKVEPLEKDANIVKLTYDDVVPERAVDVLNTIGEVYIELEVQDKATVAALTLKFVDDQLENTGQALNATEQQMQTFKEKNKTVDLSAESSAMLQKLNNLDIEKVKSDIEISSLENLYNYVVQNEDLTNMAPSSMGIPDPLLVELITGFQQLQSKRKSIAFGVKEDAPAVRVLDQQIKETRASLIENIRSIQKRMMVTRNSIQSQLSQYENTIKQVPEIERQLLGIRRNFEVNQNIYTYLLQKKAETSIAKATAVSDNKILDTAALNDLPESPNIKIILAVVILLSGLVPASWIVLRNITRSTIRNREDIQKLTTIPILGIVGHNSESSNLAVDKNPKSAIAEAFRTIRTNLQFYGSGKSSKVILITSSVGGEGKSFVTVNLSTVLAMQNRKVVVIGLDLRKPKLYEDFNIKNDIGVSNYLVGTHNLEQVIHKTKVENLDFISAGPIPPNPAELLATKALSELFSVLRERYDFIIVDTPPVGIVSDAFIVMPQANISLYIVRQNYSRLEYLRSLEDLHKEGRFSSLSIILNDADFNRSYGYGYGHNYGYINGSSGYYDDGKTNGSALTKILRRNKSH